MRHEERMDRIQKHFENNPLSTIEEGLLRAGMKTKQDTEMVKEHEEKIKYIIKIDHSLFQNINNCQTEESLILILRKAHLLRIPTHQIRVTVIADNSETDITFEQALVYASAEICKRESFQLFESSDLRIGQLIGIQWDQKNRDFFVYDIREINESRSGEIRCEYQLAQPSWVKDELLKTRWVDRSDLYLIEDSLIK